MQEQALFKFTQGLYVLGGKDVRNDRFTGSIVDAVMQVAVKPLVIALSCNNNSYTRECIDEENEFSLSVIGKNVDPFVIANFGFQSSRNVDKWNNVDYEVKGGLPYLKDNIATVQATIKQKINFESHTLFIAELCDCMDTKDGEPLTYQDYRAYFKDEVFKTTNRLNKGEKK